jgi:catecholate siderophore receptor
MQGMGDLVRYVPGVTMGQGEGHRDAPTIRGTSSTADFFVDGVRDDAQYYRDLYNTERVEALKGANAMVFGRGGGGGVINRVTKQAEWTPVRGLTAPGRLVRPAARRRGRGAGVRRGGRPVNGMYEDSRGFRQQSDVRRAGVNPPWPSPPGGARCSGWATSTSRTGAWWTAGCRRTRGARRTPT